MVKSAAKKAAGRKQFRGNPKLKAWSSATSRAYKDYKAGKIRGLRAGMGMKPLMQSKVYQAHRRSIAMKILGGK
jgi:hypothetical protein